MSQNNTYWLIAVPGENSKEETFNRVRSKTAEFAQSSRFAVPEQLKVGTLDALMQLSDDMGKMDQAVESTLGKLAQSLNMLLDKEKEQLESQLTANAVDLPKYITTFQWNEAKFPVRSGVKELVDLMYKQVFSIDNELKSKMAAFTSSKTSLASLERKTGGTLMVRSLGDIVKKEAFINDSEYLMTAMVVVPKSLQKEFLSTYEGLSQFVVPRSAEKVAEDAEFLLYGVTLFKRIYADFKQAAREHKFIVRDFAFDESEIEKERSERDALGADVKKQTLMLVRWIKTNFSEAFVAWVHIKALRTFVESVLRFGLPVNFVSFAVLPTKKSEKKVRDILDSSFAHLVGRGGSETMDDPMLIQSGQSEYYPYVYFPLSLDFIK